MDQEPEQEQKKREQEQEQEQEQKQKQEQKQGQGTTEEAPVQEKREEDNQVESERSKKISPYLTTVPTAVTKFGSFKKTNTPLPSHSKELLDAKKEVLLEGSFGLGTLVYPALQRFNNVGVFLTFYCVVVLAQGKLEEQGCSGE